MKLQLYDRKRFEFMEGKEAYRYFRSAKEVLEANKKLSKRGTDLAWILTTKKEV